MHIPPIKPLYIILLINLIWYNFAIGTRVYDLDGEKLHIGPKYFLYYPSEPYNLRHLFKVLYLHVENLDNANMEVYYTNEFYDEYELRDPYDNIFDEYITKYINGDFIDKKTTLYQWDGTEKSMASKVISYLLDTDITGDNDKSTVYIKINKYGTPDILSLFHTRWAKYAISYYNGDGIVPQYYLGYIHVNTTQESTYRINLSTPPNIERINVSIFILGLLLYIFSDALSSSLIVYLTGCFITGSMFSILAILLIILYLVSKQVKLKNWIISSIFCGLLVAGGKWSVNTLANWTILINNAYFWVILIVGGVIGLYVGYKKELTDKNRVCVKLVIDVVGAIMITHSIQLYEVSLLALILFSSRGTRIAYASTKFILTKTIFHRRIRAKCRLWLSHVYKPRKKMLTVKEYEEQCSRYTKEKLAELQTYYSDNLSKLNVLDKGRTNTKRFISGENYANLFD